MRVRGFVWFLLRTFASFLVSTRGFALIAGLLAWTSSLNVSTGLRVPIEETISTISKLLSGGAVYLAPVILVALAYRFPKTIMFLTALGFATMYLTPIKEREEIATHQWLLVIVGIALFALASVFLGLKLRRKIPVPV